MKIGIAAVLVVGLVGCDSLGVSSCTLGETPGFRITLADSVSGFAAVSDNIVAIATSPTYADTVVTESDGSLASQVVHLVEDRAGVYDVTIAADGFREWSRSGLEVTEADRCHVRTRDLVARLQRPVG